MADVRLVIDGVAFLGWQEVSVVRSIEALAGRFTLRLTEMVPNPVPRGKSCELYLEGKLIISGFIYTAQVNVTDNRHTLNISGRDKTGDLVDADALVLSQELIDVTLRQVVELLTEPFGIPCIFETDPPEKFKKFSFQQESAFEAIERACRMRGVFATSDENGNVVVRNYGATRSETGVTMGVNVLSAEAGYDDTDRFSLYQVYGQQPGTDGVSAAEAAGPSGQARDAGITRYRPKLIIAEAAVDSGLAQKRAEWEAAVRAARAVSCTVQVAGWTHESGELWRENQIVSAKLPHHGIFGDMLIKEIAYSLNDNEGTRTTMQLVRPDAYTKQPDLEAENLGKDGEGAGTIVPVYYT